MSNLPQDLVEEILSRVSAISLTRLRSTCKRWNALFKDHKFRKRHFSKARKQSQILMLKEYNICPVSVNLNVSPRPSIRLNGALSLKDPHPYSEQVYIANVFHCNGLLLCTTEDNRLVVWNPCLRETRWIHHKTGYKYYHKFGLGYQNIKSGNSYKILMWYTNPTNELVINSEIFEFNSNSWKVLINDMNLNCLIESNGVSVKGNTYWTTLDKETNDNILISFDFTRERFRRLHLPESLNRGDMFPSSSVGGGEEEQLSLLQWIPNSLNMEIWMSSKIETEEALFSKSFVVDLPQFTSWCYVSSGLIIDEEKKVALYCNKWNMVYTSGENDEYYTQIPYLESTNTPRWVEWLPRFLNYVPSLVQIQQG